MWENKYGQSQNPKLGLNKNKNDYEYICIQCSNSNASVVLVEPLLNFNIHTGIGWTVELSTKINNEPK